MFFKKERLKPKCHLCKLDRTCKSPNMGYTGDGRKNVLIIAEAPGKTEDNEGIQLIGDAGQVLRDYLNPLNLDKDFWKMNALSCRPPGNRTPTRQELEYCKPNVDRTILELKPEFIWLLGGTAVESMYMGRFSKLSISRWRRLCIPDKKTGAWIIPMYHPSYILRNSTNKNLLSVFDSDLQFAISCLDKEPTEFQEPDIECITDFDRVMYLLNDVLENHRLIAFDYETSALLPYGADHKIWSVSIATEDDKTFAFPLSYPHWEDHELKSITSKIKSILRKQKIKKVAQNLKFEDIWSREILDIPAVKGWHWCTMNAAHILDNRALFSGLKFQAYINYGIEGYDKDANKYKKAGKSGINTMWSMPLQKLLTYNGIDSWVAMKLYKDQHRILSRKTDTRTKAYKFFHKGLLALSDVEHNGIHIDESYYKAQVKQLDKKIKLLKKKLLTGKEAELFKEHTGKELKVKNKDFGAKDLRVIFFDILGLESKKVTKKSELESVDEEAIKGMKPMPLFAKRLLKYRKLHKVNNTYVKPYIINAIDDRLHPNFHLHTTVSFRGSSSSPNMQNVPVRDTSAKSIIRKGIIPSPGFQLMEVDIDGAEVKTAACYTKDSSLIKYVTDLTTDMHRDTAMDIWFLKKDDVTKEIRFHSKGGWVFAQFYGSYYKACALDLWNNCISLKTKDGITLRRHLSKNGIKNINEFIDHCREVERVFWKERFRGYDIWKVDINKFYRKNGYIESFFGFRYVGYMDEKQVSNYPIQGTAFHILLWCLIKIDSIARKEKWRTKIIGHIHDSILFDVYPDEKDHVINTVHKVMTKDVVDAHTWIIVPMSVEIEIAPVNAGWYYKEAV